MSKPQSNRVADSSQSSQTSIRFWLGLVVSFLVVVAAVIILLDNLTPNTDDAYIHANVVQISPQVSGRVERVFVNKDKAVKKGQVLFELDDRPYLYQVEASKAAYMKAVDEAKSSASLDDAGHNAAELASVKHAQATLKKAEFNLEQAMVVAPLDGYVSNVTLIPGMYAHAGTPVLTFVDRSRWWVIANFKENNMHGVKLGQSVECAISMYPGKVFHGVVARLPEGVNVHSGVPPVYLPKVKKTPNWIRLAQRFPVWVKLTDGQFIKQAPRIGATTTVVVYTPKHDLLNVFAKFLLRLKSYLYYLY